MVRGSDPFEGVSSMCLPRASYESALGHICGWRFAADFIREHHLSLTILIPEREILPGVISGHMPL
jgi:hypothetical protein